MLAFERRSLSGVGGFEVSGVGVVNLSGVVDLSGVGVLSEAA